MSGEAARTTGNGCGGPPQDGKATSGHSGPPSPVALPIVAGSYSSTHQVPVSVSIRRSHMGWVQTRSSRTWRRPFKRLMCWRWGLLNAPAFLIVVR
jgi:hypothetical protein